MNIQELFSQNPWLITVIQVWSIPWKGLALWVAAKKNDKWWFIALLVLQTLGILDIIYIFFIAKYKLKLPKLRKSK
jgi:hypothetical protein